MIISRFWVKNSWPVPLVMFGSKSAVDASTFR